MLIDTHAHLTFGEFAEDLEPVLARARDAGITRVITIGTTLDSSRRGIELAERHDGVFATIGIHPGSAEEAPDGFLEAMRALAAHPKVVAIGEIGLDYHRLPSSQRDPKRELKIEALGNEDTGDIQSAIADGAYKSRQAEVFQGQLELATELGLNVVIHQRSAWEDTVAFLKPFSEKLRGVFHCFGEQPDRAREVLDLGHLVSFTGIVTFKNAEIVRETAAAVPADRFMVETDCPYLAPVPHRGDRCEPAHTRLTAEAIAKLRGVSLEDLAAQTTATAEAFFRF